MDKFQKKKDPLESVPTNSATFGSSNLPPPEPTGAFSEYVEPEVKKKGLKISNKKSSVNQKNKQKEEFQKAAEDFMAEKNKRNQKALELSRDFLKMVLDKTLNECKSPVTEDVEKETISKLVNLGLIVNQDETEPEGYGSIAVINLLLKAILIQRNVINQMGYKVDKIERELWQMKREKQSSSQSSGSSNG